MAPARLPSVPIILVTGQSFNARSLAEMQRIFTAVLPKPVDVEFLVALLDRLMPPLAKRERDSGRP